MPRDLAERRRILYLVLRPRNCGAALAHQLEVEPTVVVGEEHRLPAIATLGDVMRDAGNDDAGEPGHANGIANTEARAHLVLCPPFVSPEFVSPEFRIDQP